MSPVTFPWHLILPSLFCLMGMALIGIKADQLLRENERKWMWRGMLIFFIAYFLIVGTANYQDIKYQIELSAFDLNKDGLFNTNERTSAQKEAMLRVTNDVGRNYSIFTGAIFGLTLGLITIGIGKFSGILKKIKT